MLRVRSVKVAIALWALVGALLHVGWTPHHALMRAGVTSSFPGSPPAAVTAALEAAEASICQVDERGAPAHPAGKTMASACPICSLQVAAALKNAEGITLDFNVAAAPDKIGCFTRVATWRLRDAAHGARGPPVAGA